MSARRVGGWCETAASLRGREPGSQRVSQSEQSPSRESVEGGGGLRARTRVQADSQLRAAEAGS
jgi:hypothetical protein